jgi:hypothetical protein
MVAAAATFARVESRCGSGGSVSRRAELVKALIGRKNGPGRVCGPDN